MPGATKAILIDAPIEKVFGIITDYEKYVEFLPEVKKIQISARSGNQVEVQHEVAMIKTVRYTLRLTEDKPSRVSWSLVKGEFMRENRGSWLLEAQGDGRTQATYSIEMTFGPLVPRAIVNALVETSLPKMLSAFKGRAEAR
jgi:ribosome-associated toxin RatA of RatAB toxin-antitoxin module